MLLPKVKKFDARLLSQDISSMTPKQVREDLSKTITSLEKKHKCDIVFKGHNNLPTNVFIPRKKRNGYTKK